MDSFKLKLLEALGYDYYHVVVDPDGAGQRASSVNWLPFLSKMINTNIDIVQDILFRRDLNKRALITHDRKFAIVVSDFKYSKTI